MARPKLHMRYQDLTESQAAVFKEVDGSLLQIGSDFGTSATQVLGHIRTGGVAHFQDRLYAVQDDSIWEYVPASGAAAAWSRVYNFVTPDANPDRRSGLWPLLKDGLPVLTCMYRVSAGTCRAVFVSSSGTFSETANKTFTDSAFNNMITHKNQLVWTNNFTIRHNIFDPNAETITIGSAASSAGAGESQPALISFEDDLYMIQGNTNGPGDYRVQRLEGATPTNLFGFSNFNFGGGNLKNEAFTDGTSLYSIVYEGGVGVAGWHLHRLDPTLLTAVDLSSLLPAAMQGTSPTSNDGRVWIYNDIEDGNNEIIMAWSDGAGDGVGVNFYRWDGEVTGFTFLGSAGAASWCFAADKQGGGHRTFSASGELNAQFIRANVVGTSFELKYRIFGDGETNVAVGWKFDKDGEQPQIECSLSNPSAGSQSGNFITGLTADGTTLYSVNWLAGSQGINPGDFPRIVSRAFRA